jgi:hypothetical protein
MLWPLDPVENSVYLDQDIGSPGALTQNKCQRASSLQGHCHWPRENTVSWCHKPAVTLWVSTPSWGNVSVIVLVKMTREMWSSAGLWGHWIINDCRNITQDMRKDPAENALNLETALSLKLCRKLKSIYNAFRNYSENGHAIIMSTFITRKYFCHTYTYVRVHIYNMLM